jgi:hypothetical protein
MKMKSAEEMKQDILGLSVDNSNYNENEDVGYSFEPKQEREVKRFESVDEEVVYNPPEAINPAYKGEINNDVIFEGEDLKAAGLFPELSNQLESAVKRGDRVMKKIIPTNQKGWDKFFEDAVENYDGHIGKKICVEYFLDPEIEKSLNSEKVKNVLKIGSAKFEGRIIPKYFSQHVRPKRV